MGPKLWENRVRNIGFFLLAVALLLAGFGFFLFLDMKEEGSQGGSTASSAEDSLFAEIRLSPTEEAGKNVLCLQYMDAEVSEEERDAASGEKAGASAEIEAGHWEAYIPSEDDGPLYVFLRSGYTLRILTQEGAPVQELHSGDRMDPPEHNTDYQAQILDRKGQCREETSLRFYYSENVASLYLQVGSDKLALIHADRNNSATCQYVLYRADGELDASGECRISGRGHTTWQMIKKPYNLNLTESKSLLGIETSSKYCLLANAFDHSNLRNWTAQNLAQDLQMPYTPQCAFVNVYIDGAYNGLYLLSQRPRANGGSIQAQQSGDLQSGAEAVVIFDGRAEDKEYYFLTEHRSAIVSYPKDPSKTEVEEIRAYYQEAENAVFAEDESDTEGGSGAEAGSSVEQYLDLNSWMQMYVFQECFAQSDVENFSFYTCMLPGDSRIYAAPIWDFDLSGGFNWAGNYATVYAHTQIVRNRRDAWTSHLIANRPEFSEQSDQYYTEKVVPALASYIDGGIEEQAAEIQQAAEMNRARWQIEEDPKEEVRCYVQWLQDREEFLLTYWADPDAFCRVRLVFDWGTLSYYVREGDAIGYLPACGMESGRYGEETSDEGLIGWEDERGNSVSTDFIINGDISLYAVYEED